MIGKMIFRRTFSKINGAGSYKKASIEQILNDFNLKVGFEIHA
jgi:hypothetical protein